jgi:hypothetical protein
VTITGGIIALIICVLAAPNLTILGIVAVLGFVFGQAYEEKQAKSRGRSRR